jgi:hypothetical protein
MSVKLPLKVVSAPRLGRSFPPFGGKAGGLVEVLAPEDDAIECIRS